MAKLTIITPVFNGARYMAGCIENVRSQCVEGVEHLIVDGGSTDGTKEIVSNLLSANPSLRLVSEKDAGQSDAMNKGIRLADSEIIGFLNVDDFYQPGAVAEGLEFLERHPDVDFVAGDCNVIDEAGRLVHINAPSDLRIESLLLGREYAQMPENPSAYFYRKRVHAVVGNYDVEEHSCMDHMFLMACAAQIKMTYIPRRWGNFRLLPGTKTSISAESGWGAKRRQAIRTLWIARLSPAQRWRMKIIKLQKYGARLAQRLYRGFKRRLQAAAPQ